MTPIPPRSKLTDTLFPYTKRFRCGERTDRLAGKGSTQPIRSGWPTGITCGLPAIFGVSARASGRRCASSCGEIGRAHVELQSYAHLVCRLLLEKKKQPTHHDRSHILHIMMS